MARLPQVTRTIPTTKATVLVLNIETGISEEKIVSVPREYKKTEKLRKAIEAIVNTETEKLAHIKSTEIVETLYGMSEQEFIQYAQILPPRGAKADEDNVDEDNFG